MTDTVRDRLAQYTRDQLIEIVLKLQEKLDQSRTEGKQPEPGDLRKSNLMKDVLYASINNTPLGLIIWEIRDSKPRIHDWNPAAERIFGWPKSEVIGRNFFDFLLPEDDHQVFQQIVELLISKRSPHNYQNQCLTRDKREVLINWFNSPIFDEKNKRIFVITLTEDVTEHYKTEASLRETNQTYQALIQGSPLAIIMVDREFRVKMWNPSAEKIFGWPDHEVLNKGLPIVTPGEPDEFLSYLKVVFHGKSYHNISVVRQTRDESSVTLTASMAPLKDAQGKISGAMIIGADTTEKDRAERALKQSELQNRALLSAIPDLMFRLRSDGIFMDMVPSSDELLVDTFSELLGKPAGEMFPRETARLIMDSITRTLKTEETSTLEFQFPVQDQECDFEMRMVASGEKEVLAIIRNVSELKKVQQKIQAALDAVAKSERVKTAFLNNISYEIFTPLNSILGYVDLVEKNIKGRIGKEDQGFFDSIRQNSESLMRMIREITDISQVDAGEFELKPEPLDLIDILDAAVLPFKSQAENKELQFKYVKLVDKAVVQGDRKSLEQALAHILDNAVKYTQKGTITVTVKAADQQVLCSVQDTGIGMSYEFQKQIFDIFSQESSGYARKYKGLGLGLALTKRYLDLNNVAVSVSSTKHKGTTFTLTLDTVSRTPVTVAKPEKITTRVSPAVQPHQKLLVLVVEDDAHSQRLMNYYLQKDYGTCFAISVAKAKEQLEKQPVGLILLDLSLQGDEDGLDFAHFIRQSEQWKKLPIIVTTAHASVSDRERCLQAGCNEYLAKPVKQQDLLNLIAKYT